MARSDSPLGRSIGFKNLLRGLIAVAAIVAVGAAFAEGRYGMAIAVILFLVAAVGVRIWMGRIG